MAKIIGGTTSTPINVHTKQDRYIVKATFNSDLLEFDKTYIELLGAIIANKQIIVWVNEDTVLIPLSVGVWDDRIVMTFINQGVTTFLTILSDNTTSFEQMSLADGHSIDLSLNNLWGNIGDLEHLKTNNKDNIVSAINEIAEEHGQDIVEMSNKIDEAIFIEREQNSEIHSAIYQGIANMGGQIQQLEQDVGDVDAIATPTKREVVSTLNFLFEHCEGNREELIQRTDRLEGLIGNLDSLETTDKSNTVAAINEISVSIDALNAHVGDLQNLDTVNKVSVVDAINEVMLQMGDIDTALENIIAIQSSYISGDFTRTGSISLKDTTTDGTYQLYITEGKLTMEVAE